MAFSLNRPPPSGRSPAYFYTSIWFAFTTTQRARKFSSHSNGCCTLQCIMYIIRSIKCHFAVEMIKLSYYSALLAKSNSNGTLTLKCGGRWCKRVPVWPVWTIRGLARFVEKSASETHNGRPLLWKQKWKFIYLLRYDVYLFKMHVDGQDVASLS